jgi:hypothetical protein
VGSPLETDGIDPRGMVEITAEFDRREEVLTPKVDERFGSYDLNEAVRYVYFLSNHIQKGGAGQMTVERDWPHGIRVSRRATNVPADRSANQVLIRRICLRYEDGGRACFVPEAEEEFFSRDDAHRVVGTLHKGSETLEWGPVPVGYTGTGPYDTGAV